jgi:CheY-like chemotaxis protein
MTRQLHAAVPTSETPESRLQKAEHSNEEGSMSSIEFLRSTAPQWPELAFDLTLISHTSSMVKVRTLVVDDADVIRKTLMNFLKGERAIKLLGEASNFAEAISMTAALKPDVVLLDLHMPDDHSFNTEFVKANLSGARVLAMSLSGDYASEEDIRLLAENFGAVRTLDKAKLCDELIPAILQTGN